MITLGIESSTELCSIALNYGSDILQRHSDQPRQHAEQLLPMIDALLGEAGINRQQIEQIAVGRGPGSFTGIRVACSAAQGIGYSLDIPVVPISSLAALAQAALFQNETKPGQGIIAVQDARLSEIYAAVYQLDDQGSLIQVGEEQLLPPEHLAERFELSLADLNSQQWIGAGSGWDAYETALTPIVAELNQPPLIQCRADARSLITLALDDTFPTQAVSPELALPIYLRDQVTHR